MDKLNAAQIKDLLRFSPGWVLSEDGKSVAVTLRFASFSEAWSFMSQIALAAEAQDHHPQWSNTYRVVTIRLTTHEADGLTRRDFAMVKKIESILKGYATMPATLCKNQE